MDQERTDTAGAPARGHGKRTARADALALRADGLAERAAQSLQRVLEKQTGERVSHLTAASIRLIVRNIIDAAVAKARTESATS